MSDPKIDHTLENNGSFMIKTPQGLAWISHLEPFGTTVYFYENPEHNPTLCFHASERKNV